jgi:vanillate O-demethylase monooxygenase subunit
MAGWARDFTEGKLVPVTMLGEKIVIFRKSDGSMSALADRCSHRLAPLSLGRVECDKVRCMYHGVKFDCEGNVVEVPFGGRATPAMKVRHYAAADKHSAIWVWMGEPSEADINLIPPFIGIDAPEWAMLPGQMEYKAHFRLINDNLLDLSHVTLVHMNSFLAGRAPDKSAVDQAKPTLTVLPNGVRVERVVEGVGPMQMIRDRYDEDFKVDQIQAYDFLVPGIFLMRHTMYPLGTVAQMRATEKSADELGIEPLYDNFTCQAVTPIDAKHTRYFYAFGPWATAKEDREMFADIGYRAFCEDKVIIEGQQEVIDASPGHPMRLLPFDAAPVRFNRILDDIIAKEAQRKVDQQNSEKAV